MTENLFVRARSCGTSPAARRDGPAALLSPRSATHPSSDGNFSPQLHAKRFIISRERWQKSSSYVNVKHSGSILSITVTLSLSDSIRMLLLVDVIRVSLALWFLLILNETEHKFLCIVSTLKAS